MTEHKEDSITINDALKNIKSGKYIMPAFQRQYVWEMSRIEKLWDSILLGYPISTFLFWHVDESNVSSDTLFCNFLGDVSFDSKKQADNINYRTSPINFSKSDTAILDGQQRLTSLLLSLFYTARIRQWHSKRSNPDERLSMLVIELNENVAQLSDEDFNTKKYDIRWTEKVARLSPTQFDIKKIMNYDFENKDTREAKIEETVKNVPSESKEYAKNILKTLCNKIYDEPLIRFTEIFNMNQDDALEMFVRFNSGGRPLKKSEITMSILGVYWPNAKDYFHRILTGTYKDFHEDFIIRTALMLYGDVAKSNINKKTSDGLKNHWNDFVKALQNLEEVLEYLKIDINRFSSSWNVLLPIIYVIYNNPDYRNCITGISFYLVRAILFSYFKSGTTGKLQQMRSYINNFDLELSIDLLEQVPELRVTDARIEDILMCEKGSKLAGEVLYYLGKDWIRPEVAYEQDHIHPLNSFNSVPFGMEMGKLAEYRKLCNRLPNIELLDSGSNGKKTGMLLRDWYNSLLPNEQDEFKLHGIIPEESMEIEDFEVFYEKRKEMLMEKIKNLLG